MPALFTPVRVCPVSEVQPLLCRGIP